MKDPTQQGQPLLGCTNSGFSLLLRFPLNAALVVSTCLKHTQNVGTCPISPYLSSIPRTGKEKWLCAHMLSRKLESNHPLGPKPQDGLAAGGCHGAGAADAGGLGRWGLEGNGGKSVRRIWPITSVPPFGRLGRRNREALQLADPSLEMTSKVDFVDFAT